MESIAAHHGSRYAAATIRVVPDPVLRRQSEQIERFDSELRDLADAMLRLMKAGSGIGLAAPQLGVLHRLIVADTGNGPLFVVNPRISSRRGTDRAAEGCLSIPGYSAIVSRAASIGVIGWTLDGAKFRAEPSGLLARVIQHEIDHLNGVLICDLAEPLALGPGLQGSVCRPA